jgi:hypothetical protein
MRIRFKLFLLVTVWAASAWSADAQQPDPVVGRIVGPDNAPLGGQSVVLHRVQAAAGATVSEAVTGADGNFQLAMPAGSDTSALFFVATRYAGELYIGAPFRAGERNPGGQFIQVGVPGTSATAMLEGGATAMPQAIGRRPLSSRSWLLFVIPLVGVAAVAVYALIPRNRVAPERAMLIRVAELDERMDGAPTAHRSALLEERTRLMTQLRGS